MSVVTGTVLMCSVLDGESDPDGEAPSANIVALNAWLTERNFKPLVDISGHASGTKHPQCCIFAAGYNYFDQDGFAQLVLSMQWECPKNVVLVMQPEDGETQVLRPPLGGTITLTNVFVEYNRDS